MGSPHDQPARAARKRLSRLWPALLAAVAVAAIAYAVAAADGRHPDVALLYVLPALWMSYRYGRPGAVAIVGGVALAQGVALLSMPAGQAGVVRWIVPVIAVAVVAAVVSHLAARNARLSADLAEQNRLDPLTGLPNRRGLQERLDIELARALRRESHTAVAMLDIDHFSSVNGEHGREVGDRVLAWVGAVLARQTRGTDVAARMGDDVFVVLLPETDAGAGTGFAERVRQAVGGPDTEGERRRHGLPDSLALTVSVGVAGAGAHDAASLMDAAERALYLAKNEGRDRVVAADFDELRSARV